MAIIAAALMATSHPPELIHKILDANGRVVYVEQDDGPQIAFLYDSCDNMIIAIHGDGTVEYFENQDCDAQDQ